MGNYRELISKRRCLVNAVIWTIVLALNLYNYIFRWGRLDGFTIFCAIVMTLCAAVHWYRYLAYDKKRQEADDEKETP